LPVLPVIDLLILMGWSLLAVGAVLKAVAMTTAYRPSIASLGAMDFLLMAVVCLLFALALAARTWVKANEPQILARQRSLPGREPYLVEPNRGMALNHAENYANNHANNHAQEHAQNHGESLDSPAAEAPVPARPQGGS